ncbi:hypothetical protein DsansV1_C21g0169901 [Dioscorea sansibarensis]
MSALGKYEDWKKCLHFSMFSGDEIRKLAEVQLPSYKSCKKAKKHAYEEWKGTIISSNKQFQSRERSKVI